MFQPDQQLRPDDANVVTLGLHGMFDTAERTRAKEKNAAPKQQASVLDADGDGVIDTIDACPTEPEDQDGVEDDDGCPEYDKDGDGIPDAADRCPKDAEDLDAFQDEDGCPDEDNDKDTLPDAKDLCPNEAEVFNKYADEDGCSDSQQIRVVGDKIELDDRVHFSTGSSIIRIVSYPLLERLAQLINAHPDYVHISIEGHTDRRGPPTSNLELSQLRAEAVRSFLVEQGVDENRLSAQGFGMSKPLVEEVNEYADFINRRVAFLINRRVKKIFRSGPHLKPKEQEGAGTEPTTAVTPSIEPTDKTVNPPAPETDPAGAKTEKPSRDPAAPATAPSPAPAPFDLTLPKLEEPAP